MLGRITLRTLRIMTENTILVRKLAYIYKFKNEPESLKEMFDSLFYPVVREGIEYYMVGRNNTQQFYLGVDDFDRIWKLSETNDFDEEKEVMNFHLELEKVDSDLGYIGHC